MKTDSLFYKLLCFQPSLIFELVDLGVEDITGYSFRSEEIKQTAFRIDGILIPREEEYTQPVVFTEFQFQVDKTFYSRFFSEIFLYLRYQKPQHPWQGVVIYPNRNVEHLGYYQHYRVLLESSQIHRIYLQDYLDIETESLGIQLLQLMMFEAKEKAIKQAKAVINKARNTYIGEDLQNLLELIETIVVYRLPKLSREEIEKMLDITYADLKKTQFYKDVFAEGEEKGIEKGELKLLLRLCKKYYGDLDSSIIKKIETLSLKQIDELANLLIEQQNGFSLEALTQWLFPESKN